MPSPPYRGMPRRGTSPAACETRYPTAPRTAHIGRSAPLRQLAALDKDLAADESESAKLVDREGSYAPVEGRLAAVEDERVEDI